MSVDSIMEKDQASLQEIDKALAGMMSRLRRIADEPCLTQDTFVEISSIYNNVSYIFLYLESNAVHINYDWLLPWRQAFHSDSALDKRLLELLQELRCSDAEVEEARQAYLKHLCIKLDGSQSDTDETLEVLKSEVKAVLREIQEDQFRMLERLGANAELARPEATFYRLVSETEKSGDPFEAQSSLEAATRSPLGFDARDR